MSIYDFSVTTIDGQQQTLDLYRGRVLLIVNVASKCGFTPQYAGLEALFERHRSWGLTVLGFPCDQFGNQEPSDEAQIKSFCSLTYNVTFPMFAKVQVNGTGAHPLFEFLKASKRGLLGTKSIKWNFTKFLVSKDGAVLKRFGPMTTPQRIEKFIAALRD
jgi:glutathione peroxidase